MHSNNDKVMTNEMVMGFWLIIKGFNPNAVSALDMPGEVIPKEN